MRRVSSYFFVVFIFICVLGFCWSTGRVSPWLFTHNLTFFCCWFFRTDHRILQWRCWESRWRWYRGTRRQTRDNKWHVVRYFAIDSFAFFGEMWFLTTGPLVSIPIIFAELPEWKNCGCFLRSITVANESNSLTYTVASSLVCTSPLAVITVVGLLDILMLSNSAESRSLLLTICRLAPESSTNSLSSGCLVDAAGKIHSSEGEWNVALSYSLSL